MKKILVASVVSAGLCFGISPATAASSSTVHKYLTLYHSARSKFGASVVGCNLIERKGNCHTPATPARLHRSIVVLERMLAPPAPRAVTVTSAAGAAPVSTYTAPSGGLVSTTAPLSTTTYSSSGGYENVPGVPSSFASCVAFRESTDGKLSSNIYGIQGSGGQGSVAEQKAAFSHMYADRGINPWHPYDHCG